MAKKEKVECRICRAPTTLRGKVCSACRTYARDVLGEVTCGPCRGYHKPGERCPKKDD